MIAVLRPLLLAAVALLCQACSTLPLGDPKVSLENLEILRAHPFSPLDVGAFTRGAGLSAARDASHGLRSNTVVAPRGSFAAYLGETARAELAGAGLHQVGAPLVLRGELLDTQLDGSGTSVGTASLSARIELRRAEQVLYRREFQQSDRWQSAFMGVAAIPDAVNHYEQLYRRLLFQLFADPAFAKAAQGK